MALTFTHTNPTLPNNIATVIAYGRFPNVMTRFNPTKKIIETTFDIFHNQDARIQNKKMIDCVRVLVTKDGGTINIPKTVLLAWDDIFNGVELSSLSDETEIRNVVKTALYEYIKTLDEFDGLDFTNVQDA
jgi:hypothetical protein